MAPFPVRGRYRFGEGGESREASFHGLLFDRSHRAVLGRLEEAHSFAPGRHPPRGPCAPSHEGLRGPALRGAVNPMEEDRLLA